MGRIMMFNRVTADGYFAAPDGNLNWVVPDEELDKGSAGKLGDAGTILFGRHTYEMFEKFWPYAVQESGAKSPHGGRPLSKEQRAMGVWINEATKIVISRTRKEVSWKNSRLMPEFDPRAIEALKNESDQTILIFGSGSIVSQLTQHRLIDDYQFIVCPALLGAGRSLIRDVTKTVRLHLQESKAYPSGNVMLHYSLAQ